MMVDDVKEALEEDVIEAIKGYDNTHVHSKLAEARVMLQKEVIKKSGKNGYNKFAYFNLQDFLPKINEIFKELKLSYNNGFISEKWYELEIKDCETGETLISGMPVGQALAQGNNEMQNIGAIETYCRRYRLMAVLGISESDKLDEQSGMPCDEEQQAKIKELYTEEEIAKMLKRMKLNNLTEITWVQAVKMISKRDLSALQDNKETF